jgi:hypothetical protein
LAIGFLPFIFLMALCAGYGALFARLNGRNPNGEAPRFIKLALLRGLHVRALWVDEFSLDWQDRLTHTVTYSGARAVVHEFRLSRLTPVSPDSMTGGQ